jgi:hypothetical protein
MQDEVDRTRISDGVERAAGDAAPSLSERSRHGRLAGHDVWPSQRSTNAEPPDVLASQSSGCRE